MPKSDLNKFFDKIFVISLFDRIEKWQKVSKQFKKRGINIDRFIAIDGRCKDQGKDGCLQKLKTFEMIYNVRIPIKKGKTLQEMVPAASLTIGTILLLREMVKRKWKRMLICEDDIELTRNMENTFKKGIAEIGRTRWDMLYLGCGSKCGYRGFSDSKTGRAKHLAPMADMYEDPFYTFNKNDLRDICDDDKCIEFSQHISWAYTPGGTWCYAYSLAGAKKVLKLIANNAGHHIDQLLGNFTKKGHLRSLTFDPPIVMHEDITNREATSDIPWKA